MNYERIIVELLSRIQTLEENVALLLMQQEKSKKKEGKNMTTNDVREYIKTLKLNSKNAGNDTLVLRSGDIHKELNLKDAMPTVCNAMRQCMEASDVVLHTTPSGNSSTIEIEYRL